MTFAASLIRAGDRIASRERVRTIRMQRHLTIAGLAWVACVVIGPTVHSLFGLLTLTAFVGVVLSSLARAVDARLGNWWGWVYGEPEHSTGMDLLINGFLSRLISVLIGHSSATDFEADTAEIESRVRILPLGPDQR
jgi:hypothetical protein